MFKSTEFFTALCDVYVFIFVRIYIAIASFLDFCDTQFICPHFLFIIIVLWMPEWILSATTYLVTSMHFHKKPLRSKYIRTCSRTPFSFYQENALIKYDRSLWTDWNIYFLFTHLHYTKWNLKLMNVNERRHFAFYFGFFVLSQRWHSIVDRTHVNESELKVETQS